MRRLSEKSIKKPACACSVCAGSYLNRSADTFLASRIRKSVRPGYPQSCIERDGSGNGFSDAFENRVRDKRRRGRGDFRVVNRAACGLKQSLKFIFALFLIAINARQACASGMNHQNSGVTPVIRRTTRHGSLESPSAAPSPRHKPLARHRPGGNWRESAG